MIFWVLTSHSIGNRYHLSASGSSTPKMEAEISSETLITVCSTMRGQNPEHHHNHHCVVKWPYNTKSC